MLEQLHGEPIPPYGLAELLVGAAARDMEPRLRQACLTDAWIQRIRDAGRRGPTVLVFEDLHWCDPASLHVLARLTAEAEALGLVIVLSWRAGFAPLEAPPTWEQLALGPLAADAAEALLVQLLGQVDSRSRTLIERSAGVPLFIEQLALAVRNGVSPDAIPSSLQAIVLARLDRLGHGAAQLARAAAVLGREFTVPMLARVASVELESLDRVLEALVADGMIQPMPPVALVATYRFTHSLLQQSAYESIPDESRRSIHESCLEAIRAGTAAANVDRLLAYARHCEGAGRTDDAIAWWAEAGRCAMALSENAAAVEYFRRALALRPDGPREFEIRVEMLRAQELTLTFTSREASDNAERALELLPGASNPVRAASLLYLLGGSYIGRADVRIKALSGRTEALALDSPDPWLRASFSAQCGNRDLLEGKLGAARAWYLRSLKARDELVAGSSRRTNPLDPRMIALAGLSFLEALRCSPDARVYAERALASGPESDDSSARCYALVHLAQVALIRGEFEVASSRLAEAEAVAETRRMDLYRSLAILFRACMDAQIGEPVAAAATIRACLDELAAAGWGAFVGFALSYLALAEERRSNWSEAREALERAIDLGSNTLDGVWVAELRRRLAAQKAQLGDPIAEVAAEYERAIALARSQGAVTLELRALASLVDWHPESAPRDEARAALASLAERPDLDSSSRELIAARALLVVH
jgi:tetratricopeptide (TPR) repeat protein